MRKIDRVKSSKRVGVYIDETLSWNHHTDYIFKKISRAIGGLKQVRRFVPTHTLITIYKALIQPLFDYRDNNAPAYLQGQFKKLKDSVPYNLRNADVNLALPKPNSEYLKKSFGYSGAVAWNSLPRNLQNSKTLNEFRQNLNSYRLHQGSY